MSIFLLYSAIKALQLESTPVENTATRNPTPVHPQQQQQQQQPLGLPAFFPTGGSLYIQQPQHSQQHLPSSPHKSQAPAPAFPPFSSSLLPFATLPPLSGLLQAMPPRSQANTEGFDQASAAMNRDSSTVSASSDGNGGGASIRQNLMGAGVTLPPLAMLNRPIPGADTRMELPGLFALPYQHASYSSSTTPSKSPRH